MARRGKYANPPVIEALCELHFHDGTWDETVPGRFYDRLAPLGFAVKESTEIHEANLSVDAPGGPSATMHKRERMRFTNPERSRLVQVEPRLVVLNQLRPYPQFETWCPLVVQVGEIYAGLTGGEAVARVGMRYINQIDLPGSRVALEDWFEVAPKLPASWKDEVGSFLVRAERFVTSRLGVVLTLASTQGPPNMSSFVLDVYAVNSLASPVGVTAIQSVLEEVHGGIEATFEGSITQALRDRFGSVT